VRCILIVAWNLAALVPIWLGAWSVFAVLALYWFENLCTGIAQHRKLRDLERRSPQPDALFAPSAFFAVHYGLFTAVHGLLVLVFFGVIQGGLQERHDGWWISALVIVATQWADYRTRWVAQAGWTHARAVRLMVEPYARTAVLHAVVICGGWLALSAADPRAVLLVFAGVKLVAELTVALLRSDAGQPRTGATAA
jgi:hypothetical protein